jgi:protein-S-isoprenylcysteine O-methyltransferase Ste14
MPAPLKFTIICWFAFEIGLLVRDVVRHKNRLRRDRGTRLLVSASLGAAFILALAVRGLVPSFNTPAPHAFVIAGCAVMWIGLAVRIWAVLTLGRSFSTFLGVATGQTLVTQGPYRWVRHPSYTGLLTIALGFGIGMGNWLSPITCVVLALAGLLPRMAVEESQLLTALGDRYRHYQRTTDRLIPGLW